MFALTTWCDRSCWIKIMESGRWKGNDQEPIHTRISHLHPAIDTKWERDTLHLRRHKIKTARVESKGDSSFQADAHQAILNKMKKNVKDKQKVDEH